MNNILKAKYRYIPQKKYAQKAARVKIALVSVKRTTIAFDRLQIHLPAKLKDILKRARPTELALVPIWFVVLRVLF